jgi:quercetin dioxygenase-like cupin family protein
MKRPKPDKPLIDERLAVALLEAQAPILPAPERARALRERVLGRVRQEPLQAGAKDHLTIRGGEGRWFQLMPGASMKPLREDETTRSYLLRLAPGVRLPPHDHSHDEECMVLEGEVWLGDVHAHAGDYHLARRGLPHGEMRTETGCLLFLRGQKHYAGIGAG